MSIESKIKELLARKSDQQLNEEGMQPMGAAGVKKDTSIPASIQGDATMPRQGSSQDADYEERDEKEENQGAVVSKSTPNSPRPGNSGAGNAPNYMNVGDPTSVVNMQASSGNKPIGEEAENKSANLKESASVAKAAAVEAHKKGMNLSQAEDHIYDTVIRHYSGKSEGAGGLMTRVRIDQNTDAGLAHFKKLSKQSGNKIEEENSLSLKEQLSSIFGDDLSEDFRDKATSIFEAAVIARVNDEMEYVIEALEEQKQEEMEQIAEGLVDKIDGFMNYVVEQWMEENQLAVSSGIRTEIAEDFIAGLKTLFEESFIDVPDDKVDIVEHLSAQTEELETKLNETLEQNIELSQELTQIKKALVLGEMTGDLADTEAEKLQKLLEGVQYDSEDLFREKVKVIKENYFPKSQKSSPEEQLLTEEAPLQQATDTIAKYAQALSRSVKMR
jgi:regulator of replication initiation timing